MISVNLSPAQFERLITIVAVHCDNVEQQIADGLKNSAKFHHGPVNLDSLSDRMKVRDEDKEIFNILLNTSH